MRQRVVMEVTRRQPEAAAILVLLDPWSRLRASFWTFPLRFAGLGVATQ